MKANEFGVGPRRTFVALQSLAQSPVSKRQDGWVSDALHYAPPRASHTVTSYPRDDIPTLFKRAVYRYSSMPTFDLEALLDEVGQVLRPNGFPEVSERVAQHYRGTAQDAAKPRFEGRELEFLTLLSAAAIGVMSDSAVDAMEQILALGWQPTNRPIDSRRIESFVGQEPSDFGPYGHAMFRVLQDGLELFDQMPDAVRKLPNVDANQFSRLLRLQAAAFKEYHHRYPEGRERWPRFPRYPVLEGDDAIIRNWMDALRTQTLAGSGMCLAAAADTQWAAEELLVANRDLLFVIAQSGNRIAFVRDKTGTRTQLTDEADRKCWKPPAHMFVASHHTSSHIPDVRLSPTTIFSKLRVKEQQNACMGLRERVVPKHNQNGAVPPRATHAETAGGFISMLVPFFIAPMIEQARRVGDFEPYRRARTLDLERIARQVSGSLPAPQANALIGSSISAALFEKTVGESRSFLCPGARDVDEAHSPIAGLVDPLPIYSPLVVREMMQRAQVAYDPAKEAPPLHGVIGFYGSEARAALVTRHPVLRTAAALALRIDERDLARWADRPEGRQALTATMWLAESRAANTLGELAETFVNELPGIALEHGALRTPDVEGVRQLQLE
jgi:hypothetical protein